MKRSVYLALQLAFIAFLGFDTVSSSLSQKSVPNIHKFVLQQARAEPCNGVLCMSHQYCYTSPENMTYCAEKKPLAEACTALGQCRPSNSECLVEADSMTCQCTEKFVTNGAGECVLGCSGNTDCSSNTFCNTVINGCLPQVDLNSQCVPDSGEAQCKTENAECESGSSTCKCTSDFVEKNGACIAKCSAESCNNAQYCDASGLCQNRKYLGELCEDSNQCLIPNSECSADKKCTCKADFPEHSGSCEATCSNNEGCTTENQYCDLAAGVCTPKGNLHAGCSAASGNVGQCLVSNAECLPVDAESPDAAATCECSDIHAEINGECVEKCDAVGCTDPDEYCHSQTGTCQTKLSLGESCLVPGEADECSGDNVVCHDSMLRCSCKEDFIVSAGVCKPKCTNNNECSPNQYCSSNLGLCAPKLELNGYCSKIDEGQCKTAEASCQGDGPSATCSCNSDFVQELGNSICVLKCTDLSCDSDKYCHTSTSQCFNKVDLNNVCISEDGATQCKTSNTECRVDDPEDDPQSRCRCLSAFYERAGSCQLKCKASPDCANPSEYCETETGMCKGKVGLDQGCSYEDQCSASNAECVGEENNKRCQCISDHVQWVTTCRPKCKSTSGCENSEYCNEGSGLCYKKVGLHQKCAQDIECKSSSAVCDPTSKTCKCGDSFLESGKDTCKAKCTLTTECDFKLEYCSVISGRCYNKAPIHQTCVEVGSPAQCLDDLTTCKDSEADVFNTCECTENSLENANRCNCVPGYIATTNVKRCLLKATQILGPCEDVNQCLDVDNEVEGPVTCSAGKCTCSTGFVLSSNVTKCLKVASVVGEECEEPQQCLGLIGNVNPATNASVTSCTGNKCACTSSSVQSEGKCFLKKAIGDTCESMKECSIGGITGDVDCTSKKCSCASGSKESADGKACAKVNDDNGASQASLMNIILLIVSFLATSKYCI